MIAETSMLFASLALAAIATLAWQVRRALPLVRQLRSALDAGPQMRELRWTLREVIVVSASPKVVAFPRRSAPALAQPSAWRRAA